MKRFRIIPRLSRSIALTILANLLLLCAGAASSPEGASFRFWEDFLPAVVSTAPQLTISSGDGETRIGWPLSVSDWALEQSPFLDPPVFWARVPLNLYGITSTNVSVTLVP